jgi:restriction endonuclease S subunit
MLATAHFKNVHFVVFAVCQYCGFYRCTRKQGSANLEFTADGDQGTMRIDDAVKNKLLKVYSGRSLAAKTGEEATGILHVGKSTIIAGGDKRTRQYSAPSNSRFLLEKGDVLLTTLDQSIETLVWNGTGDAAPGVGVTVIRILMPTINPTHLAWSLRGRSNASLLSDDGRMRFGVLDRFEFSFPPIASQNKVAEKLESFERIESAMRDSLFELGEMRQKISTNLALTGLRFKIVPKDTGTLQERLEALKALELGLGE